MEFNRQFARNFVTLPTDIATAKELSDGSIQFVTFAKMSGIASKVSISS